MTDQIWQGAFRKRETPLHDARVKEWRENRWSRDSLVPEFVDIEIREISNG